MAIKIGNVALGPGALEALDMASNIALGMGESCIESEHLLLALIRQERCFWPLKRPSYKRARRRMLRGFGWNGIGDEVEIPAGEAARLKNRRQKALAARIKKITEGS